MKSIVGFLIVLSVYYVNAQTTISGIVYDPTNNPMPGVNIFVKDTYDGTVTSIDGTFSFKTTEVGEREIIASMIGFKNFSIIKDLQHSPVKLEIRLEEQVVILTGAVVTASSEHAVSDRQKATVFKPIEMLTTAGANADITFALQTLPGTQQVGEQTGLFVRGGSGEFKFDGYWVYSDLFNLPNLRQQSNMYCLKMLKNIFPKLPFQLNPALFKYINVKNPFLVIYSVCKYIFMGYMIVLLSKMIGFQIKNLGITFTQMYYLDFSVCAVEFYLKTALTTGVIIFFAHRYKKSFTPVFRQVLAKYRS